MAKKVPIRTCISCGESSEKRTLVRIVKSPWGYVSLDKSGKAEGRGAYVCENDACFENACKKHLFDRRLRTKLSNDDYERLEIEFEEMKQER